ncbi:MAG: alpha/beta hydrolase [Verrucomicrobiota bacterium]
MLSSGRIKRIIFGDFILSYEIRGTGRPFVFLHDLGMDRRQSLSMLEGLEGSQLITIDLPGHGESICATRMERESPYSHELMADAIHAVLQAEGIAECVLGGIGMGTATALKMTHRYPERVAGLLFFNPSGLSKRMCHKSRLIAKLAKLVREGGILHAENELRRDPAFGRLASTDPEGSRFYLKLLRRSQALEHRVLSEMAEDCSLYSKRMLRRLEVRTKIVGFAEDSVNPSVFGRWLHRFMSFSSLELLDRPQPRRKALEIASEFLGSLRAVKSKAAKVRQEKKVSAESRRIHIDAR